MEWLAVAAVAVMASFIAVMLRRSHPEQSMAVTLAAGVLILVAILSYISPILKNVQSMLEASGLPSEYVQILFKALGICVITQLASDACRDAGEQGLATKTEFAGKLTLLALALPLFQKIGEIAVSLIGKE